MWLDNSARKCFWEWNLRTGFTQAFAKLSHCAPGKTSLNLESCEDCPYEERLNAYKSEDRSDLVDARADLNLALTQIHYSKVT